MCKYVNYNNGVCNISSEKCPYVYYCNKSLTYKESRNMPSNCKIKQKEDRPKDSYEVCFARHGNLYVQIEDYVEIIANPYNYVPKFVNLTRTKNGKWRIKSTAGV